MSKTLGSRIKEIRTNKNISREQLAVKLEISIHTLTKYEQGQREPNIDMLNKIAEALSCSTYDLLYDTEQLQHDTAIADSICTLLQEINYDTNNLNDDDYEKLKIATLDFLKIITKVI